MWQYGLDQQTSSLGLWVPSCLLNLIDIHSRMIDLFTVFLSHHSVTLFLLIRYPPVHWIIGLGMSASHFHFGAGYCVMKWGDVAPNHWLTPNYNRPSSLHVATSASIHRNVGVLPSMKNIKTNSITTATATTTTTTSLNTHRKELSKHIPQSTQILICNKWNKHEQPPSPYRFHLEASIKWKSPATNQTKNRKIHFLYDLSIEFCPPNTARKTPHKCEGR